MKIRLLPYMDIPIAEDEAPNITDRRNQLVEWADGDLIKLSAGFIAYKNEGENPEDYILQIAFIKDNCLVTNQKIIKYVGSQCLDYRGWKKGMEFSMGIRKHVELYYDKIKSIPPWGSSEYVKLEKKGMTPRILIGPHKGGELRPNQRRRVILNSSKEIVYGPLL